MRRALWALLLPSWALAAEPPSAPETIGFEVGAEYRVRTLYVNPLDLNGTEVRDVVWTQQRARVDATMKAEEWFRLVSRFDLLDGVLFGDNGRFSETPSPNTGVGLSTKRPNDAGFDVALRPGADPLDVDSYEPRYQGIDPLQIEHFYADVVLPFGLLRLGRQPANVGVSLGAHDGGRHNRWGVSTFGDTADRLLLATKLDQAYYALTREDHTLDPSLDEGLFLATWMDVLNHGLLHQAGDELIQNGVTLIWKAEALGPLRGNELSAAAVHLGGDDFETDAWAFPGKLQTTIGPVTTLVNWVVIRGESEEISHGFAALSQKEPELQDIESHGLQTVVDYRVGPVTLTFEFDWASGDADPRTETPITNFAYPRDLNVGLLLFEHILAFQSARSAAVGIENLRNLDSPSFPLTEVDTDGRFTNALALFPQVLVEAIDTPRHRLTTRVGVLLAWPDDGVVDPVATTLAEDGNRIDDDAVNFAGGDPGDYYGTEIDLQIQWTYRQRFVWTLEGAVLFPGNSLEDENGDAVTAFFGENRFEFLF